MGSGKYNFDPKFIMECKASSDIAVNEISKWGTSADNFVQKGHELDELKKVLKGLEIFKLLPDGQIIFGLLNGGIELFTLLEGNSSSDKEKEILKSVNDVSSKVTSLSLQLDQIYSALEKQLEKYTAALELYPYIRLINDRKKDFDNYTKALNDKNTSKTVLAELEKNLFGENNRKCEACKDKLFAAIQALSAAATSTDSSSVEKNIMQPVCDLTHGDVNAVLSQGTYMIRYATIAMLLYGVFSARLCNKETTEEAQQYLKDMATVASMRFGESVNALIDAIPRYTDMCRDGWFAYAKDYVHTEFNIRVPVGGPDTYQPLCDEIKKSLEKQWKFDDWFVSICDRVNPWNGDTIKWSINPIVFDGFGSNNANINVVILKAGRDPSKKIDLNVANPVVIYLRDLIHFKFEPEHPKIPTSFYPVSESPSKIYDVVKAADRIWYDIEHPPVGMGEGRTPLLVQINWWERNTKYACTSPNRAWLNRAVYINRDSKHQRNTPCCYDAIVMI